MTINISYEIKRLVQYGLQEKLFCEDDRIYVQNQILEALDLDILGAVEVENEDLSNPQPILDNILQWAYDNNLLEENSVAYRDLLDTKIMNCMMPRPSEVIKTFNSLYKTSPQRATEYYYSLSKASNYIRTERISKNIKWKTSTEYGELDITINLSKPEKDPRAIAKAKDLKASGYPKCLLCKENEGYEGRANHPARQNHRIMPIILNDEKWFFQYSPYEYYKEHCIVFKDQHTPMVISRQTFKQLLDFVNILPHYTVGSNAELPLVGASILTHVHFQGGSYQFPMAMALIEEKVRFNGFNRVSAGILRWPMSVIRLIGQNPEDLVVLADRILTTWKEYNDSDNKILAYTGDTPHNTVTPIARKRNNEYELDIVLRNNRANDAYPYGIFHPHKEIHHIKKENIGLIEVMGLAVLPSRLRYELDRLRYYLLNPEREDLMLEEEGLKKHLDWYKDIREKYEKIDDDNVQEILENEVGRKFLGALEYGGVFKRDMTGRKAFNNFIAKVNER